MSRKPILICIFLYLITAFPIPGSAKAIDSAIYKVSRVKKSFRIDADWNKPEWRKIKEISINNFLLEIPAFRPIAKAKMAYDKENLYLIFNVEDRHVRIQVDEFNGPVSGDACVEFFFSPDSDFPMRYFNLEINAGGTALMAYHENKIRHNLTIDDFRDVEMSHTLPNKLVSEISEPVSWTIEIKLPIAVLEKFATVTQPKKGVVWKANFYKTSSKSSNPHWITWSLVDGKSFHLPEFFGTLKFK